MEGQTLGETGGSSWAGLGHSSEAKGHCSHLPAPGPVSFEALHPQPHTQLGGLDKLVTGDLDTNPLQLLILIKVLPPLITQQTLFHQGGGRECGVVGGIWLLFSCSRALCG